MDRSYKRKKKLINPSLQLRLVAVFLCTAGVAVQVEAILIALTLSQLAGKLPNDGGILLTALPEFLRTNLLLTLALLVPLTIGIGVVATFKIAGPLYRFEQFLRAVRDGEQTEPCRIREGDELRELCQLLNEVTAPLRERGTATAQRIAPEDIDRLRPALPAQRRHEAGVDAGHATSEHESSTDRE